MTLKTKYEIGQNVWACLGGEAVCGKIIFVAIYVNHHSIKTYYTVNFDIDEVSLPTECLFHSKEELIKNT